jgi:hypothetical protein
VVLLMRASQAESTGRTVCSSGDVKNGRRRLGQAAKRLQQFVRRLRAASSRRAIPGDLRLALDTAGDDLRSDAKTLRATLDCPSDATASGVVSRGR